MQNVEENDVVVWFDESSPNKWPLARVVKAKKSPLDGNVRSVILRTGENFYERDVTRLCIILKNEQ